MTSRSLRSIHRPDFCAAQPVTQPRKSYALQCFPPHKKCPYPWGHLHLHVIYFSWTQPTQHPEMQFDRFSRFCSAHGRESPYFTLYVKTRLTRLKINRLAALLTIRREESYIQGHSSSRRRHFIKRYKIGA